MRSLWPKKKSKLAPKEKAQLAAWVLHQAATGEIDDPKVAGRILRETIGLNWSFLTAVQYLTGQEALHALTALPEDTVYRGVPIAELLVMIVVANDMAANVSPGGGRLCAGRFVDAFKRPPPEG